jgi:hypothetical protein
VLFLNASLLFFTLYNSTVLELLNISFLLLSSDFLNTLTLMRSLLHYSLYRLFFFYLLVSCCMSSWRHFDSCSLFLTNQGRGPLLRLGVNCRIILWCAAWEPKYWNQNIRLTLVNGFTKHVSAATNKSVTSQRLAKLDVFNSNEQLIDRLHVYIQISWRRCMSTAEI